jgi:hypothetical protein
MSQNIDTLRIEERKYIADDSRNSTSKDHSMVMASHEVSQEEVKMRDLEESKENPFSTNIS